MRSDSNARRSNVSGGRRPMGDASSGARSPRVVALAGGIGAARFLRGLVEVVDPAELVVVANTGDDLELLGLHISPDLDTITYTLGGGIHPEQGWGRAEETHAVTTELEQRYGRRAWFSLGDRDLATHLHRTRLLAEGRTLTEATAEIAAAWELPFRLLPMTDERVETRIHTVDGRDLHFQEWWVGEGAGTDVAEVRLDRADDATPAPGVLGAIATAEAVVLCPSNPIVSIGTILEIPGIRAALRHVPVVGISPIVGGKVVRGMAHRLLPAAGSEVTAVAVAERYADFLDAWVIDDRDAALADAVSALGVRVGVTDTLMRSPDVTARIARTALDLLEVRAVS
jgi:LPPG:FO 2-phospho-L-lactate transferase